MAAEVELELTGAGGEDLTGERGRESEPEAPGPRALAALAMAAEVRVDEDRVELGEITAGMASLPHIRTTTVRPRGTWGRTKKKKNTEFRTRYTFPIWVDTVNSPRLFVSGRWNESNPRVPE